MDANPKKAMHSINLIKQYQELALTARDVGELLGRRTEITWAHGEGRAERVERAQRGCFCINWLITMKRGFSI